MRDSVAPVTVIIPCLNAESTLGEAIESVFAQSAAPLEVLVIDDKSRDRSVQVAQSFGSQVRVLANPGRGPGAARRLGVEQARGEYIAFVDADDAIEPEKHERQLAVFEENGPYTVVHTGSILFWPDGRRSTTTRSSGEAATGRCTRVIFEHNPVCGASCMLSRKVVLELGNYDADLFGTEDLGMSLQASTRCDFVHLPEPLYRIRRHTMNITNRSSHMAYMHWLAQERFRIACPQAFAELPAEVVQSAMIEPVIRALRQAYYQRDSRDYQRLLALAKGLVPYDPEVRRIWGRRHLPMACLRWWDRMARWLQPVATNAA